MFKAFLIVLLVCSSLFAEVPSFNELRKYPRSIAKDYYIYRFLKEKKATKEQAQALYSDVKIMNSKLIKLFKEKKVQFHSTKKETCKNMGKNSFLKADIDCQAERLNPSFALLLSKQQRYQIHKNLKYKYPQIADWLLVLSKGDFKKSINYAKPSSYMKIYNGFSHKYRKKYFNSFLSKKYLQELQKEPYFSTYVKNMVLNKNFPKVTKSFMKIDENSIDTDGIASFYLGLNSVIHKKIKKANKFFAHSIKKSEIGEQKDRSLLWAFLTSKDKSYLQQLAKSKDFNIYSVYAKEFLGLPPFEITIPKTPQKANSKDFDITNPLKWHIITSRVHTMDKNQMKKFAEFFHTEQTMPHYIYLQERITNYQNNYFIIPYEKNLQNLDPKRQALILALAKQESRFIPTAISTSYALGLMQFMPFLAKHIAKEKKIENFDLDDMFNPNTAYEFANFHLDYLERFLHHPLFIAYAYNGGIGFARGLMQNKNYFTNNEFEPFLSMERIYYPESRIYGKKVLANYIAYSKLLDINTSIIKELEKLKKPDSLHRF